MHINVLLNLTHPIKGFVYGTARTVDSPGSPNGTSIEVDIRPRKNSRGPCSGCGRRGPTYDTQRPRRFAFVPLWGLEHRDLTGIRAIGVDEVAYAKGHRYATLVYQIDSGHRRLLHVAEGRTIKRFLSFFVTLKRAGRRGGGCGVRGSSGCLLRGRGSGCRSW